MDGSGPPLPFPKLHILDGLVAPACGRRRAPDWPVHSSEQGILDVLFWSQTLALKSAGGLFSRTEEKNSSYLKILQDWT